MSSTGLLDGPRVSPTPPALAASNVDRVRGQHFLHELLHDMASQPDWWLTKGSIIPRGVHRLDTDRNTLVHIEKRVHGQPPPPRDLAGDEIFDHSRVGRQYHMPSGLDPPYGRDGRQQAFASAFASPRTRDVPSSPPVHDSWSSPSSRAASEKASHGINSSWRAPDNLPFTLDGSPRARAPNPTSVRDPELAGRGYAKPNGSAREGYGSEMIFGVTPPERPNLDLQVAQWRRLCTNAPTNDGNAFTIDGSLPLPTPRKDPRRKLNGDIMPHALPGDVLGREGIWKDLGRAARFEAAAAEEAATGVNEHETGGARVVPTAGLEEEQGGPMSSLFLGHPSPRNQQPSSDKWRRGDDRRLSFDDHFNVNAQAAVTHRSPDQKWRNGDTFQFAFDGSGGPAPRPNPFARDSRWRTDEWSVKDHD